MGSADDCSSPRPNSIAIVGGGFTGATLAARLLREAPPSLSVWVIERGPGRARGLAYGTENRWHLLNVPAANMSAWADDPEHFLRWARLHYDARSEPTSFLPRPLYARYLAAVLEEAEHLHPGQLHWISDEACSLAQERGTARITLRSGGQVQADRVVLACGNFPASDPQLAGRQEDSRRYISQAWSASATQGVEREHSILLIGSGLTAVDLAIALRVANFRGIIHMLSRRGLVPHSHESHPAVEIVWGQGFPPTARGLSRMVRKQVDAAPVNWRPVIDSLRPFTQSIWRSLEPAEKRRFLRHLRPFWESHRHRIAPKVGSLLSEQLRDRQIEIHAGRLCRYQEDETGVEVSYRDRRSGENQVLRVERVINCTGPETDCRKVANPLVADLLAQGLIAADRLSLGFDVTEDGRLIEAGGEASEVLYAVGPPRKANLWEATAVPEIRDQVTSLVAHLLAPSGRPDGRN